ncbi:MAG: LysR family transcriptional regulator [Actinomycetota bacterium]
MPLSPSVPELAALDLFVSVVELGSLSRAAAAHRITQPSASSRIRTVESQVGLSLLDRSPTGSRPTPEGELVATWAADVLRSAGAFAAGVEALKAERRGLLRLASSYTVAEYLLPVWLDGYHRDHPDVAVRLDVTNSDGVIERLSAGTVDLGFVESPSAPTSMRSTEVARDDLVVVVSPAHRWATSEVVDLEEFANTPLVLRERGSGTRAALEQALASLGHAAPTSELDLGSLSAVRIATINGSGPTVISRLAVERELRDGSLRAVRVDGLDLGRTLRAIEPPDRTTSRSARDLLAHITGR